MAILKNMFAAKPLRSPGEAPTANMDEVVMKKANLLEALINNKAKHDVVLANAIIGYWDVAKARVAEKQQKLISQVAEFQESCQSAIDKINHKIEKKEKLPDIINFTGISIDSRLGLIYPEDHSRDYDRAISMMQDSIYEDVRLTVAEYESYVLNNWEWKNNFLMNNSAYFDTAKSLGRLSLVSGCSYKGEYATQYQTAADNAVCFMASGLLADKF